MFSSPIKLSFRSEACDNAVKAIQKYFDDEGVDIVVDILPITSATVAVQSENVATEIVEPEPVKAESVKVDPGRKVSSIPLYSIC